MYAPDFKTPTTKTGYYTYTDGTNTVWVKIPAEKAPALTGPTAMSLRTGYAATSTDVFTVTGNPQPTVAKVSGDTKITWNNSTKRLQIAPGLAPGSYPVTLKASNGIGSDATLTFTLTVSAAPTAMLATGDFHAVALRADGTLWSWGYNYAGQLGDGTAQDRLTPVPFPALTNVAAIAAHNSYTIVLKWDGTVWACGSNGYGQLGDGTTISRSTPVQVTGLSDVVAIAAGLRFATALQADGTIWSWGDNDFGQLGDGTTINRPTPVYIGGPIEMQLTQGYAATSTQAFAVTGYPAPTVTKQSGSTAITWNDSAKKLEIPAGLAVGNYPVVLKAGNGVSPDATVTFTLRVTAALSSTKDILTFSIPGQVSSAITGTAIAVTMPSGTKVTGLTPSIGHNGASISPASGAAQNFTNPVNYTVTAADASTKSYTVTVTVAPAPPADKAALNEKITEAEGKAGDTNYTTDSRAALQTAITAAKAVRDNLSATQTEVNAAAAALTNAVNALQLAKGIFGTNPQWYGEWWHYLLFFFGFGFIWMW